MFAAAYQLRNTVCNQLGCISGRTENADSGPLYRLNSDLLRMAMGSKQPNILYIVSDQQRYDTLACNGNPLIRSPNLDRLAADGVRFSNAYTVCATSSPARASMLTGMYPHRHGMLNN